MRAIDPATTFHRRRPGADRLYARGKGCQATATAGYGSPVQVRALVLETLRSAFRRPAFWLLLAVALLGWRGLELFLPLGIATEGMHRSVAHYQVAFVGGFAGMLLVLASVARFGALTRPQGAVSRTFAEALGLLVVASVVGAVVLVPTHTFELWQYADFDAPRALAALLVAWLHVAVALVAVVLRPVRHDAAPRPEIRLWALAVVGGLVVVPGLLVGTSAMSRTALFLLDAGGILRASFDFPPAGAHWIQSCLPIVGWGALAVARASPAAAPPSSHAVRHPR